MKHVLIFLLGISTANAMDCPPDHPIKRTVVDYTKTVTCTAVFCTSKLICEPGYDICTIGPAPTCNNCDGPTHREQCFTQEELEAAK